MGASSTKLSSWCHQDRGGLTVLRGCSGRSPESSTRCSRGTKSLAVNLNVRQTNPQCEKLCRIAYLDTSVDQPDAVPEPRLGPGPWGGAAGPDHGIAAAGPEPSGWGHWVLDHFMGGSGSWTLSGDSRSWTEGWGSREDSLLNRLLSLEGQSCPCPLASVHCSPGCRVPVGQMWGLLSSAPSHQRPLGSPGPDLVDCCRVRLPGLVGRLPLLPGRSSFPRPCR